MFVLADCNNFYVSCERVFAPELNSRPVIVMSGNDGCVIARSNEAKALGIEMGVPVFKIRGLIQRHNVKTLSGNIVLYGDMSRRVMSILKRFAPSIEIYSIDEAFMDFSGTESFIELYSHCEFLTNYIFRATGIPVSFGIAPTKTLAKIASKLAKKTDNRVYQLTETSDIDQRLSAMSVKEIWGVGKNISSKLQLMGVYTAFQFREIPSYIIRQHFSVVLERTRQELLGNTCFDFDDMPQDNLSISSSRSFSQEIYGLQTLKECIANFVEVVNRKLRKQNSLCRQIVVYIQTNRFDIHKEYHNSASKVLENHSDSLLELTKHASQLVESIYLSGYGYKKAGVILMDIIPSKAVQPNLFEDETSKEKNAKLQTVIENLNNSFGRGTLVTARRGFGTLPTKKDNISPQYTTSWQDILVVK